jgi:L-alanine-DL-glutamate epimerase-like enolase superfamily enzyme
MKLTYTPYTLYFKHPFIIAHGVRTSTPVVFTEIEYEGMIGYGEASMPPYLGENHETVVQFLKKAEAVIKRYSSLDDIKSLLAEIDVIDKGNTAAKAAVDISLHDLLGKIKGQPCYSLLGLQKQNTPAPFYTIGMDKPEMLIRKIKEAKAFSMLKIKLGSDNDKEIIETIREATDKSISVDVNQGWKEKEYALDMIHWLKEKNVLFVEQPLAKGRLDDVAWLSERSPLDIIADEDVQRFDDIDKLKGIYKGVNIKLMKCTGMYEAYRMMLRAREHQMKILIGCMSETSCAVSAAAQLSPLCDWADLDGPLLIKNNCFEGVNLDSGRIELSNLPGIGVKKK